MGSRFNGSNKYPHTQADEDFNRLMDERDRIDALPRVAARVAFNTELAQSVTIDAPRAGDAGMQPAEVQHEHPLVEDHPVAS